MSKLPPIEKLPLALRKSVRDDWDAKKADVEKKLSDILGEPWTIDVNPNQIYVYAKDNNSYVKQSLGHCVHSYFDDATRRLDEFRNTYNEDGVKELNTLCHAHVMTMDIDEEKRFSYGGVDVHEGQLRILFAPDRLGSNISDCLNISTLLKALNDAPAPEPQPLSFSARTGIRQYYDPKIEEIRKRIGEILEKPDFKLTPNFEANFAKLTEESKVKKTGLRQDWQEVLGNYTKLYFEGLASQLEWQKFEDDELLREGLNDVLEKGEVVMRIVDKLESGSYNECVFEDGILYIQTTPKTWGSNISDAAQKLVDKL